MIRLDIEQRPRLPASQRGRSYVPEDRPRRAQSQAPPPDASTRQIRQGDNSASPGDAALRDANTVQSSAGRTANGGGPAWSRRSPQALPLDRPSDRTSYASSAPTLSPAAATPVSAHILPVVAL